MLTELYNAQRIKEMVDVNVANVKVIVQLKKKKKKQKKRKNKESEEKEKRKQFSLFDKYYDKNKMNRVTRMRDLKLNDSIKLLLYIVLLHLLLSVIVYGYLCTG